MIRLHKIASRRAGMVLLATSLLASPVAATPGGGFAPSPVVTGHYGKLNLNTADDKTGKWGMILKTLDLTDVGVDKLTVQPSGTSGWHAHPSSVFITVTSGTIMWYDGSDPLCTAHSYTAGQSFIETAYTPHNVRNASSTATAEFYATTLKPAGFVGPSFRIDVSPRPNNCGS